MKDYTIYVTKEIAKKAMEKGFKGAHHTKEFDIIYNVCYDLYDLPTAEQICGWLDEQNIQVTVRFRGDCWYYDIMTGLVCRNVGNDVTTRKEALLEGINKALDLI